ncbi:MAG: acetamidase/formamidase family protein, partial [Woeseia sp.]
MKENPILVIILFALPANSDVLVGSTGTSCAEDPACINRLHPDIPMVASADPGERIIFVGRDALDLHLDPDEFASAESIPREGFGMVHALTGPVHINGAGAGDVLAVTIEDFKPGSVGWTDASPFGFAGDQFATEERFIVWRINDQYAVSDAIPGVRIPNASFPGVVTTLPGHEELKTILSRETELLDAGGA